MTTEYASSLWRRLIVAFLIVLAPVAAFAATAKTLYESALARERTARAEMSTEAPGAADPAGQPRGSASLLKEIRAIENAYLAVVRQHPSSSYCDDALWNAGRLALDAFAQYGQPSDRETGIRLLNLLVSQYPTSKFAKRVSEQISGVAPAPAAPPAVASARPPSIETQSPRPAPRAATGGPSTAGSGPPAVARAPTLAAGSVSHPATIRAVTRTVFPDVVRVTIDIDNEMPFHEERLDSPPRVFVDFPSTRAAPNLADKTLRFDGDAELVRQIRIGRHPNATTRVVLDAAGVTGYSVYALYNPYRLVIDCARPAAASLPAIGTTLTMPAKPAPVPYRAIPPDLLDSLRLTTTWGRMLPSASSAGAPTITAGTTETAIPENSQGGTPPPLEGSTPLLSSPTSPMAPAARNSAGGFSMARQLGLNVSRIVIDPGHGGHDPGAQGKGVTEAELVLDVALRLEKLLERQNGVEVVLTRRSDEFIALQERTAIANREGADLFLSIHANASSSPQARGVETYFLNFASNLSAAAVAARENAASGQAMAALPDFVKAIALNNKLDESRDFAGQVQRAMMEKLRGSNRTLKDLGVKQAPFVVLIGAAMPSVLAEISFITNPQESKLLRTSAYRQKIADALFAAVKKYQDSLHDVRKVAAQ